MKRLIKWIGIGIALFVTIIIITPFFIPLDTIKEIVTDRIKKATGRELIVAGETKASVWPNIGISLGKVSLSNPSGYSSKNIVEVESLTVEVALMPLLNKEIKVINFIISNPNINLEINKDGVANWQFTPEKITEERVKENTTEPSKEKPAKDMTNMLAIFSNMKIENGNFSYKDVKENVDYKISNANLDIKLPSEKSALNLSSDFIWNKEKFAISINAATPIQLINGGDSNLKSKVKIGSGLTADFSGKASKQNISGSLDISSPSLVELSSVTGKKMAWKGATNLAFGLQTEISCGSSKCDLNKTKITMDDSIFSGNLKINFAGKTPAIEGKLASASLNLNNYLPQPEKQSENLFINNAYATEQSGWSTETIDLSALNMVNAKLALAIEKLIFKAANLSDLEANIKLSDGELALDVPHIGLYEGTAKLSATANANNSLSLHLNASNLQIEPALRDFADFKRLSGVANINAEIYGKGNSQKEIISSLNGKGNVRINDGAIKGIDLAKMASSAKSFITGEENSTEKTNFSELGGSFTITQGIVKNGDLAMKAPLLRMKGEGTVDLPVRYVNYKLFPSLVATLQGQGGKDKTGLEIPILVEGNFEKLKFTPDLKGAAQEALKDPEKIKESVRNVKDTVKNVKDTIKDQEGVKNILKGFR